MASVDLSPTLGNRPPFRPNSYCLLAFPETDTESIERKTTSFLSGTTRRGNIAVGGRWEKSWLGGNRWNRWTSTTPLAAGIAPVMSCPSVSPAVDVCSLSFDLVVVRFFYGVCR